MNDRIPVLATILAALELCRANLPYAVKIMAPWFIAGLTLPNLLFALIDPGDVPDNPFTPWGLVEFAIYIVGWCSIAVLWHWRILRDASQSNLVVTFDQRVWSYLVRMLLISLAAIGIVMVAAIPLLLLTGVGEGAGAAMSIYLVTIPVVVACVIATTRLSIALPAVALNRQDFGLGDAWRATSNNNVRLLLVTLLPTIPIYFISGLIHTIFFGLSEANPYGFSPIPFAINMVITAIDFAIVLIGLSILSLAYRFFVENPEARTVMPVD